MSIVIYFGVRCFFFFFQAEDGIRDVAVTGVQTCALPISFSGDLAPALMTLGAEVDIAGPAGRRTMALKDLYIGYARQDEPVSETCGDGKFYLSLRPGEFVTGVRARDVPGLRSAYDKIRIRRSIEYPVCGVAVALHRTGDVLTDLRVAFTGTNPRPVLLNGTAELCGGPLEARVFNGLDALV